MTTSTQQIKDVCESTHTTTEKAIHAAINATNLARSCLDDLGGMFQAIRDLTAEHSTVHTLAGVGLKRKGG